MATEKPTVFISFNCKSAKFVDSLQSKAEKKATIIRYEDGVETWGSFKDFMDTIRDQDFAVLVISDAYLKSKACMYEVLKVMESPKWTDTTMFVVMHDADIYSVKGQVSYTEYWSKEYDDLSSEIAKLPESATAKYKEDLQQIESIRDSMGAFLTIVADEKNPDIWDAIDVICDKVSISRNTRFMYQIRNDVAVNVKQAMIIDVLQQNGALPRKELCDYVQLSPSEFRYHMNSLIADGYVMESIQPVTLENCTTRTMKVFSLADEVRPVGA